VVLQLEAMEQLRLPLDHLRLELFLEVPAAGGALDKELERPLQGLEVMADFLAQEQEGGVVAILARTLELEVLVEPVSSTSSRYLAKELC
jgi:hypothetical protein